MKYSVYFCTADSLLNFEGPTLFGFFCTNILATAKIAKLWFWPIMMLFFDVKFVSRCTTTNNNNNIIVIEGVVKNSINNQKKSIKNLANKLNIYFNSFLILYRKSNFCLVFSMAHTVYVALLSSYSIFRVQLLVLSAQCCVSFWFAKSVLHNCQNCKILIFINEDAFLRGKICVFGWTLGWQISQ